MTKQTGLGDNFYVGQYDLSGDVGSIQGITSPIAVLPVTGIDKSAPERRHGKRDGSMDWSSWFNDAAGQEHVALSAIPATDRILSYFRGTTIGKPAASISGKQLNYDPARADDGSLKIKVQGVSNGFATEWGRMLTAGKRTDTAATNGSSLDYGAAVGTTNFGLQVYIHVFAFSGTNIVIKVQDSPDNSAWADLPLATSGTLTGVTALRAATSETEAVDRYLRVVTTSAGGFTSCTFAVQVKRNKTAPVF